MVSIHQGNDLSWNFHRFLIDTDVTLKDNDRVRSVIFLFIVTDVSLYVVNRTGVGSP